MPLFDQFSSEARVPQLQGNFSLFCQGDGMVLPEIHKLMLPFFDRMYRLPSIRALF